MAPQPNRLLLVAATALLLLHTVVAAAAASSAVPEHAAGQPVMMPPRGGQHDAVAAAPPASAAVGRLLLCTIVPRATTATNSSSPSGGPSEQEQPLTVAPCFAIQAHLQPLSSSQSQPQPAASYRVCSSRGNDLPVRAALLLPTSNSSERHAAGLVATLHVQQEAAGRVHVLTASQLLPAGSGAVPLHLNMSHAAHSWPTQPEQQPEPADAVAAAAASTDNATAAAAASGAPPSLPVGAQPPPAPAAHLAATAALQLQPLPTCNASAHPAQPDAAHALASAVAAAARAGQLPAALSQLLGYKLAALQDSSRGGGGTCPALLANSSSSSSRPEGHEVAAALTTCPARAGWQFAGSEHPHQATNSSASMATRAWQLSVDAATQSVHLQASASLVHVAAGAAAALLLLVVAARLCSSRPGAAKQHSPRVVQQSKQGATAAMAGVQPAGARDQRTTTATAAPTDDARTSDAARPAFDAIVGDPFAGAEDPFQQGDEDCDGDEHLLEEYGQGDPFEGDPFGYAGVAPVGAAASSGGSAAASGSGVAAAAAAVRRASTMAAGEAAGALKDAFLLRAAHSLAAKEEEEARVNALPPSAQRQLQAGGRWARDGEGRLVRHGSSARRLQAVRASLVAAAVAVTQALSGGGSAGSGGGGGGVAERADADALAQLMAAAPGQVVGFGA